MLNCPVFGGKTSPFPVGRVFRMVRPVATVRFRVEPEPEPTREFEPVANTSQNWTRNRPEDLEPLPTLIKGETQIANESILQPAQHTQAHYWMLKI
jgi:hypothetical protein